MIAKSVTMTSGASSVARTIACAVVLAVPGELVSCRKTGNLQGIREI
jgi:hypothetical protein